MKRLARNLVLAIAALIVVDCGARRASAPPDAVITVDPVPACKLGSYVHVHATLTRGGAPVPGSTLFFYFVGSTGPGDVWATTASDGSALVWISPLALGPQTVSVEVWAGPPAETVSFELDGQ